jgi:uncharacterized protein (DUF1778 family)
MSYRLPVTIAPHERPVIEEAARLKTGGCMSRFIALSAYEQARLVVEGEQQREAKARLVTLIYNDPELALKMLEQE